MKKKEKEREIVELILVMSLLHKSHQTLNYAAACIREILSQRMKSRAKMSRVCT